MSDAAAPYRHLRVVREGPVSRIRLARPEVRNAFDETLIAELTRAFLDFVDDAGTRVVVLTGEGPVFCAGADVAWMRRAGSFSRTENETEAERMAGDVRAIDRVPSR